jgi:hypothetical protein
MRQPAGSGAPQLAEWDENHKFVKAWGEAIAVKAHGMTIDAQGKSGAWDEAKGTRLLWQPLAVAFAPNGDMYIGEGIEVDYARGAVIGT